jgi:hypothetical protein
LAAHDIGVRHDAVDTSLPHKATNIPIYSHYKSIAIDSLAEMADDDHHHT